MACFAKILLALLLFVLVVSDRNVHSVLADDAAMAVRSFERFEFDTVTASGLWAEVATSLAHEESQGISADLITVESRLVYGAEWIEGGLFIPYERLGVSGPISFAGGEAEENGIGDLQLYGKAVPLRTEWVDAGIGLEISLPSGDESKGLGAGSTGFLPYGMAAVHLGPADLRGHFGYDAFLTSDGTVFGRERAPNVFIYGWGLFGTITDRVGVRTEFVAETFDGANDNRHVLSFEPGFDVRFPLGSIDLLIRPTGAVGLTHDSPDWGVGGAVTVNWDPSRQH